MKISPSLSIASKFTDLKCQIATEDKFRPNDGILWCHLSPLSTERPSLAPVESLYAQKGHYTRQLP
ncbi:protein of unknown function [Hyphomicrobium sp. MC1]|nr:protein of unknown function [Hyphomicrobium sp. MC1]